MHAASTQLGFSGRPLPGCCCFLCSRPTTRWGSKHHNCTDITPHTALSRVQPLPAASGHWRSWELVKPTSRSSSRCVPPSLPPCNISLQSCSVSLFSPSYLGIFPWFHLFYFMWHPWRTTTPAFSALIPESKSFSALTPASSAPLAVWKLVP